MPRSTGIAWSPSSSGAAAVRSPSICPRTGTPFAEPWPLAAWPDVPTRFVQGRDDRFFPLEYQRRIVRERLGIGVEEVPGGHLAALSRPVELVDTLEELARRSGLVE